jgi:hypothetical protein
LHADVAVDGDRAEVTLHHDGPDGPGSRTATVRIRRRYPVLDCGKPPEEAKKSSPEYEVV